MASRYDFGKCPTLAHQVEWIEALGNPKVYPHLTPWEKAFLFNVKSLIRFGNKLNEEQIWKLEQIYTQRTT